MKFSQRSCPGCDGVDNELALAPIVNATEQSWEDIRRAWLGLFLVRSFFPYHRCRNCGLLYDPVYFSQRHLDELYASMPPNMAEAGDPESLRRTQEGYFELVCPLLNAGGGYLELGPDVGTFARACALAIAPEHYWLIEPNRAAWDSLRSHLPSERITIDDDMETIAAIPDGSINLAVGIHVLDHLLDPVGVLRMIRPKMAPGGVFLSVTHDERSWLARLLGARWPAFCLQHPQLYNRQSIASTFAQAGYQTRTVLATFNVFPVGFLVRQATWALLRRSPSKLGKLESVSIRMRLGNIAAVASPKF